MGRRWRYLTAWRDVCSRRVVGWYLVAQMPTGLVFHPLKQALTLRQPASGLIVHADRGIQYRSTACRARVAQAGAVPSFGRLGNPCDNALPGTTQAEPEVPSKPNRCPTAPPFASLEEARLKAAYYLDTYFNLQRRRSALGYRSPHQFEQDLKSNLS